VKSGVRLSRLARVFIVFVALALLLAACGSDDNSGGGGGNGDGAALNGSGSTFQQAYDEAAIEAFGETNDAITINYAGGGSGKGKTDLQTKTVEFAGTDSLIKEEDLAGYGGTVLYFPTVAAPITVSYNLEGLEELSLDPETLAAMFSGTVTKWNDAKVAATNSAVDLPDEDIVIVHRAEASGTTSNFTKYLASAGGSAWTLGEPGDTVNWPAGSQAGQGNSGVAQIIKSTAGSIGYVDYSDAVASDLTFAKIQNKAGNFVEASLEGASAAVAGAEVEDDLTYSPLDANGADAYPITSPTWIIVYADQTDKVKGQALKDFLTFILSEEGQGLAEGADYAKLPPELLQQANAQLSQLQIPA
jgi:phosphate transport system substrate-binding protein